MRQPGSDRCRGPVAAGVQRACGIAVAGGEQHSRRRPQKYCTPRCATRTRVATHRERKS
ncbi:hypothetical protein [Nocardia sp.]|uniref:hypothetical protein n=1 Tax=Nocardia sp. TaxID=1821 RepID=UPI0034549B45